MYWELELVTESQLGEVQMKPLKVFIKVMVEKEPHKIQRRKSFPTIHFIAVKWNKELLWMLEKSSSPSQHT